MNNRIEKFLIWAAIAYIAGAALSYGIIAFKPHLIYGEGYSPLTMAVLNIIAQLIKALPIALVCGLWLRSAAKEERKSPTAWFFLGFIFTVVGVALFYATTIYSKLKEQSLNQSR